MYKITQSLFLLVILLCGARVSQANNNLFLPGDAFFPVTLTQADLASLQSASKNKRLFRYSALGGYEMAFCGDAGYRFAMIDAMDDRFVENLRAAYDEIRKRQPRKLVEEKSDGKTRLIETNGIRVLFYRQDFPINEGMLGLRYNENWVEEAIRFGHQRQHLRLCCLVRDEMAVMASWRDATLHAGLEAVRPPKGASPRTPIRLTGGIKAIVIGNRRLEEVFRPKGFVDLYVVTADGSQHLERNEGKWGPPSDDGSPF